jgi:hypothetical protein
MSDVDELVAVGGEPGEVVEVCPVAEDQAAGRLAESVHSVAVDPADPALVPGCGEEHQVAALDAGLLLDALEELEVVVADAGGEDRFEGVDAQQERGVAALCGGALMRAGGVAQPTGGGQHAALRFRRDAAEVTRAAQHLGDGGLGDTGLAGDVGLPRALSAPHVRTSCSGGQVSTEPVRTSSLRSVS